MTELFFVLTTIKSFSLRNAKIHVSKFSKIHFAVVGLPWLDGNLSRILHIYTYLLYSVWSRP